MKFKQDHLPLNLNETDMPDRKAKWAFPWLLHDELVPDHRGGWAGHGIWLSSTVTLRSAMAPVESKRKSKKFKREKGKRVSIERIVNCNSCHAPCG